MSSFRFSAIVAIALVACLAAALIVPRPAEAHGANVKISEDGSAASGRYWDGSSGHTAPFYTDITVHSNGAVTFWGTTVCAGTIVYSDGNFGAYYNYQRIPVDFNNAAYRNGGNGSSMHYSPTPAYCAGQSAAKPSGTPVHVTDLRSIKSVFSPGYFVIMKNGQGYVFDLGTKFTFDVKNKQTSAIAAAGYSIPLGNILLSGQLKNGKLIGNDGSSVISNDGGSLIGNAGGILIGNDGSSLIGNDGSSLIGNDGSSFGGMLSSFLLKSPLIGNDGSSFGLTFNNLLTDNGSGLVGPGGSTLIGNAGGALIGNAGGTLTGGIFSLMSVSSYRGLPPATIARCADNRISVAYALSGLGAPYALGAADSGNAGKCNPNMYLGGNYVANGDSDGTKTVQVLAPVIRAATDCYPSDPWIGEALWKAGIQRQAFANSCSAATYTVNGQGWSSFGDLVARVQARYRLAQSGVPSGPVDRYGCTPPNYGVVLFTGYIFEGEDVPNLDKSKAIAFRCSNQLPAGYTRPYPVPANLLIALATPSPRPAPPLASNAGIAMPGSCASNQWVAIFDAKYPQYKGYFWYVAPNPTLDLHKANPVICYSQIPKDAQGYGRRSGFANFGIPTELALGH